MFSSILKVSCNQNVKLDSHIKAGYLFFLMRLSTSEPLVLTLTQTARKRSVVFWSRLRLSSWTESSPASSPATTAPSCLSCADQEEKDVPVPVLVKVAGLDMTQRLLSLMSSAMMVTTISAKSAVARVIIVRHHTDQGKVERESLLDLADYGSGGQQPNSIVKSV